MTALEKAAKTYEAAVEAERHLTDVLRKVRASLYDKDGIEIPAVKADLRQLVYEHDMALCRLVDARSALLKLSSPIR